MPTRREFVTGAAAGLAACALAPRAFGKKMDRPLGVQLYTVRSLVDKDFPGTLAAIRKIGYRTVETYVAEYKMAAKDLRQAILDAGLIVPSAHFAYNDFGTRFDYAKELGVECVVCSSVPGTVGNSADGFKRAADQYNAWGEQAKKMGLRFGFHNHNTEFKDFGGLTGIDILLQNTDPSAGAMADGLLLGRAGRVRPRRDAQETRQAHAVAPPQGPQAQLSNLHRHRARAPQHFTEVGTGTLDWTTILHLAGEDSAFPTCTSSRTRPSFHRSKACRSATPIS